MPTIKIADEAGACYGVERALQMVQQAVKDAHAPVRTLGPLIHNPRVVTSLKDQGVEVVGSASEAAGSALLLRTHGVTPQEEQIAKDGCVDVLDATCPFVKKAHGARASPLRPQEAQLRAPSIRCQSPQDRIPHCSSDAYQTKRKRRCDPQVQTWLHCAR